MPASWKRNRVTAKQGERLYPSSKANFVIIDDEVNGGYYIPAK
jgi:hypothetical protein